MNKYMFLLACFMGLFLCEVQVSAQDHGMLKADELRKACRSKDFLCVGYIKGFLDGYIGMAVLNDDGEINALQIVKGEDDVTVGQIAEMFVKDLDDHPDALNENAGVMLAATLVAHKKAEFVAVKRPIKVAVH